MRKTTIAKRAIAKEFNIPISKIHCWIHRKTPMVVIVGPDHAPKDAELFELLKNIFSEEIFYDTTEVW